jgi:hypothetical protein
MDNNETEKSELANSLDTVSDTLKELKSTLTATEGARQYAVGKMDKYRGMVEKASDILKTAITNGEVDGEDEFIVELCDALGVELTQEVEIRVTATWAGTLTIPLGKDASDYEDYFEASIETTDSDMDFAYGYQTDSIEVEEV